MAQQFEVDLSRLNSDIDNAKRSLDYMTKNLKTMFDELKALDATWDGEANEAFNIQVNSDYEFMQDVCKNLSSLIASMEKAKTEYRKSESNVTAAIRALRF
ncbi:MAG: WXG100 family type VII secretion target [Eubacteriales bacterium]|nr:WXG100 family type VII secretion target [Eubacteriales bacterium]